MTIDDAQYIARVLGIEPEPENSSKPAKDLITGRTSSCTARGHAESDGGNDSDSESEPASESLLLKRITTTITVSQGRFPRLSDSSKTMQADLTGGLDGFLAILLPKAKRKLGKRAAMLTIEDLTVKYNWWSGKEPKKLPALFDLDEQDDFDGIFSLRLYVVLMMEGLQLKVFKSMKKKENRTLLIYITVLTSALDAEETLNTGNSNDASSPMRQVSLV